MLRSFFACACMHAYPKAEKLLDFTDIVLEWLDMDENNSLPPFTDGISVSSISTTFVVSISLLTFIQEQPRY